MLENVEEKVNALTKLADLIGKKTLVMWCIITTFTTGYLFIDGRTTERQLNSARITEIKESNDKLVKEIKGIKEDAKQTKAKVDSTMPRLDTLIDKANNKLNKIK